eukprot:m.89306 g.89306  ORF g.89306 m.89306 type:complete len:302 (-) comp8406_c0_seq2:390-1295(-)
MNTRARKQDSVEEPHTAHSPPHGRGVGSGLAWRTPSRRSEGCHTRAGDRASRHRCSRRSQAYLRCSAQLDDKLKEAAERALGHERLHEHKRSGIGPGSRGRRGGKRCWQGRRRGGECKGTVGCHHGRGHRGARDALVVGRHRQSHVLQGSKGQRGPANLTVRRHCRLQPMPHVVERDGVGVRVQREAAAAGNHAAVPRQRVAHADRTDDRVLTCQCRLYLGLLSTLESGKSLLRELLCDLVLQRDQVIDIVIIRRLQAEHMQLLPHGAGNQAAVEAARRVEDIRAGALDALQALLLELLAP